MNSKQTLLFVILATVYTVSTQFDAYPLSWLVKLLPMILLIGITFLKCKSTSEKLFLTGLIFSAAGDFFLAYDPQNWFIFGLGAFLIAHVFYIVSLLPLENKRLPFVLVYLLSGMAMFSIIEPGLGALFLPVFAYMTVLLIMACFTLVTKKSNFWLIIGGIAFAVSDSLLGVNKFASALPFASILILSTYYLAQISLVKGMFDKAEN